MINFYQKGSLVVDIRLDKIKDYITFKNLTERTRDQYSVYNRIYLTNYIKHEYGLTHKTIGDLFNVTHDIIVYYLKKHRSKINVDIKYKASIKRIELEFLEFVQNH